VITAPGNYVIVDTIQQPVTTVESQTADTGDDDSDKTGLWGLLGLLGLAGLAGLKRRPDHDTTPPTIRNPAPPTSSGATSRTDRP
jgi:MYXO-CTERM domain-containing protein